MSLKDEFNIPEDTWNRMVRRGVISCSVVKQDNILTHLNKIKSAGVPHSEAVNRTAIDLNVSEKWVYEVIRKYQ